MQIIPIKSITQTVDFNVSSTKNLSDILGNVDLTDDVSFRVLGLKTSENEE